MCLLLSGGRDGCYRLSDGAAQQSRGRGEGRSDGAPAGAPAGGGYAALPVAQAPALPLRMRPVEVLRGQIYVGTGFL